MMNTEQYRNGMAFGLSNLRTYGLRETELVLRRAEKCERTVRERFDWLCGLRDVVDNARKAQAAREQKEVRS
jgi:hypothetical protein